MSISLRHNFYGSNVFHQNRRQLSGFRAAEYQNDHYLRNKIATRNIKLSHDIIHLKDYKRKKLIEIKILKQVLLYRQISSFSLTFATILMPSRS